MADGGVKQYGTARVRTLDRLAKFMVPGRAEVSLKAATGGKDP